MVAVEQSTFSFRVLESSTFEINDRCSDRIWPGKVMRAGFRYTRFCSLSSSRIHNFLDYRQNIGEENRPDFLEKGPETYGHSENPLHDLFAAPQLKKMISATLLEDDFNTFFKLIGFDRVDEVVGKSPNF